MVDDLQVYKQNNLTFILLPEKILIKTKIQMFTLEPRTHYWNRRLILIRTMISLGEIRNLNELAEWCASGNVEWVNVPSKYYVDLVAI